MPQKFDENFILIQRIFLTIFLCNKFQFIDRVQKDAAGIYECSVRDVYGEYSIRSAQLIVQGMCCYFKRNPITN